jgi:hypothetical protein
MPTWCLYRSVFDAVGGFAEVAPDRGEAEDLVFFHRHIDVFEGKFGSDWFRAHARGGDIDRDIDPDETSPSSVSYPLRRAGSAAKPLLLYRWSPCSGTARVPRRRLLEIRVAAFSRRILSKRTWARFAVWGAGRDAKAFVNALDPEARDRIVALLDVDWNKCSKTRGDGDWRRGGDFLLKKRSRTFGTDGFGISNRDQPSGRRDVPVVHFTEHADAESSRRERMRSSGDASAFRPIPVVVCVAKRRKGGGESRAGDLERNVQTLGLVEGETLWYFM